MGLLDDELKRQREGGTRLDGSKSSIRQSAANVGFGNRNRQSKIPSFNSQSTRQEEFNPAAGPSFGPVADGPDFDSIIPKSPDAVDPTAGQAFDPPAGPSFNSSTGPELASDAVASTALDFAGNLTSQPTEDPLRRERALEEEEEDEFGFFPKNLA